MSYEEKSRLREMLDDLLEQKVIRTGSSEYASRIVLIKKKNGKTRLCVDYQILNKITARDNYPLPVIEDQINALHGKRFFTSLDLKDGFHHVFVAEDSIKYTAFITPFGIDLQGIPFKIVTDCNALVITLNKKDINPRIVRWALELQNFDYSTEHRPGKRMAHVDALSRTNSVLVVEDNTFEFNLTVCQAQDTKIKELRTRLEREQGGLFEMQNGIVCRKGKDKLMFYVPHSMEKELLQKYHNEFGHFDVDKTRSFRKVTGFPR
ncbi:uncharacterized protein LOC105199865 [Solenopsis invicta]|uniref:uncharacterized protein LOC105199865 n=1 Tax=Solenopsis invicta TaxID=13686 RepID=UPI0005961CE2|nr:uncharacterized protein LOC105199865 [Solenopsis invicta]